MFFSFRYAFPEKFLVEYKYYLELILLPIYQIVILVLAPTLTITSARKQVIPCLVFAKPEWYCLSLPVCHIIILSCTSRMVTSASLWENIKRKKD